MPFIDPVDPDEWFSTYRTFLIKYNPHSIHPINVLAADTHLWNPYYLPDTQPLQKRREQLRSLWAWS